MKRKEGKQRNKKEYKDKKYKKMKGIDDKRKNIKDN